MRNFGYFCSVFSCSGERGVARKCCGLKVRYRTELLSLEIPSIEHSHSLIVFLRFRSASLPCNGCYIIVQYVSQVQEWGPRIPSTRRKESTYSICFILIRDMMISALGPLKTNIHHLQSVEDFLISILLQGN